MATTSTRTHAKPLATLRRRPHPSERRPREERRRTLHHPTRRPAVVALRYERREVRRAEAPAEAPLTRRSVFMPHPLQHQGQ
eukprot:2519934-Pleurochrysis_carterae.AAC.1